MPSLVLDLEASEPLHDVRVPPPFEAVHALLRWHGAPVGAAWLTARNGVVTAARIRDEIVRPAQRRIDAKRVQEWLAAEDPMPDDSRRLPPVTIAICTRDRPDDLARCLAAIDALPDDGQQILVIDNAPASDASRRVVEQHRRVRYIHEPRPGLSRAHNRALREAQTEVVAFIDDDAIPDPGWLRALRREFADPRTMCVTGPAAPLELETPAQEWFERTNAFSRGFDRTVHDGATGDPFFVARVGAGVNMALRRSVLTLVAPFDEALDSGTPTLGGGDHDMFTRILAEGYRIAYQPEALVRHRHRRTWQELRNTFRAYGTGAYAYLTRHALRGEWRAPLVAMAWLPSQLGRLARALVSGAHRPYLSLGWSELLGCAAGPFAYLRSRRSAPAPVPEPTQPRPDQPALHLAARLEAEQDPPRMSVIIPTHDRRAPIERLLTRLELVAYPMDRFEVIVVADGCTDGTADLVRHTTTPFALRVEELSPGRGAAAARNRGGAVATGAILLYLDDDMDPPTWLLSEHAARHEEDADRVVVGAPIPVRPGPGATQYDIAMWSWWEAQLEQMSSAGHRFRHEEIFTGVLSIPAALFSRLGGFDESFECREDYELGARLIRSGVEIEFSRQAGAHHLELRSPERLYERKRAEGRADVALARKHPFLWPALRLSPGMPAWWTAMGTLRRLSRAPALANAVAAVLARTLPALERLHARATWRAVHSALAYLWYWRGVRDVIDEAGLRTLAAECTSSAAPAKEIDVDLAAGLRTVERRLDQERPDAIRVRFGDAVLGTISAVSGGERLRGVHLRPALVRDVGESLARVLDAIQAPERRRLTVTHR